MAEADQVTDERAWDAWRALAEKALKGEPLESLTSARDGLTLAPLYAPAEPVFAGRVTPAPWAVVAAVDADEGAAAQARADLENGATALALTFAGAPAAHGRGLTADTVDALDDALSGVMLDLVPVHLEAGPRARPAFTLFAALCDRRGTAPAALHAGFDPIGSFLATGSLIAWDEASARFADMVRGVQALGVAGTAIRADGRMVHEAGGTPAEELAFALASLAESLRALDAHGLPPAETLPLAALSLSADVDLIATVAKLRAARRLAALVAEACGVEARLPLHVTTGARMTSHTDPHTNMLRLTLAAFAAAVGGADAIMVRPFDPAASPFGRRVARNVQNLLLEESHLAAFSDPLAGSGAIEAATDEIAETAWGKFQALEPDGVLKAIQSGAFRERVAASASARAAALTAGERAIIGVTRHPPATRSDVALPEPVVPPSRRRRDVSDASFETGRRAAADGATLADLASAGGTRDIMEAPALIPKRDAEPFEAA